MKTEKKIDSEPFAIVPARVTGNRGLTASTKLVLVYLLEKYQAKDNQGNAWTFSCASIVQGTSLNQRTVERTVKTLHKHKILKFVGTYKKKTRPTNCYEFTISALKDYLRDSDNLSLSVSRNASAVETTLEALQNNGDTDKDSDRDSDKDNDKNTHYKEDSKRKMIEERNIERTVIGIPVAANAFRKESVCDYLEKVNRLKKVGSCSLDSLQAGEAIGPGENIESNGADSLSFGLPQAAKPSPAATASLISSTEPAAVPSLSSDIETHHGHPRAITGPSANSVKRYGMPTDVELWRYHSFKLTSMFGNKPIHYSDQSPTSQAMIREYVSKHRDKIEIEFLRDRSEANNN